MDVKNQLEKMGISGKTMGDDSFDTFARKLSRIDIRKDFINEIKNHSDVGKIFDRSEGKIESALGDFKYKLKN